MSEPAGLAGGFSRFRVDFAYDGTDFNGWAKQPKLRTVQGVLLEVMEQIFGPTENDFAMRIAGRTDAGVHADHQVCHFDLSPEQQKRLQDEFKTLLVRTYAGALSQVKDQSIAVKPLRGSAADTEVIVRTEVIGRGDPIQLDYRLEKTADGWRIYDLNVLGVWLVETYRSQFAQEITARGIDGLITALAERNKTGSGGASAKS